MTPGRNGNSRDAYHALEMTERKQLVLDLLTSNGQPMTDKAIKERLTFSPNTGIITEMIMDGGLEEVDSILCPQTGSLSRRVFLAHNPPRHELSLEISTRDQVAFDAMDDLARAAILFLREKVPGIRVRGRLRVKFGSRITDIEVPQSNDPAPPTPGAQHG